jgi:hypothetical protein
VHFLILGAALFALGHYMDVRSRYTYITITKADVNRIATNYLRQYGAAPTTSELTGLVDRYIDEEMFYRESLRLGLDQGDEIVRRRLAQKYEFLQEDLSIPGESTEAELRAFYQAHRDRYRLPERVTFTQVYFSPDHRGEQGARRAAEEMALRLNRLKATRAADQGDQFPGPSDYSSVSGEELVRVFGEEGIAQEIFHIGLSHWSQPLKSGYGWHTVYVTSLEHAREDTFQDVHDAVRSDYREAERNRLDAEALDNLRKQFKIAREY